MTRRRNPETVVGWNNGDGWRVQVFDVRAAPIGRPMQRDDKTAAALTVQKLGRRLKLQELLLIDSDGPQRIEA